MKNSSEKTARIFERYFSRPENRKEAAAILRQNIGDVNRQQAREWLLPYVARRYGLDVVRGQRGPGFSGRDNANSNKEYEAAKKFLSRLLVDMGY